MCLELSDTLGQTRPMRRGRPRVLKVPWHVGSGPSLFYRLWASWRFVSKRKIAKEMCLELSGNFRSDQARAWGGGGAQSSKSFLARWNRPKLVLLTLGKLAVRLQALDRKVNVPGTFGHLRSDQAHAQGEAQSFKSLLARWNRPKLVLQTLGKLAIRLQALDGKLNVL